MLAQDAMTGEFYEVPDDEMYDGYDEYPEYELGEDPMAYDHLGNPLGIPALLPAAAAILPAASKLLPAAASSILPAAGRIIGGLFGRRRRRRPRPRPVARRPGIIPRFPIPRFRPRPRAMFRAPRPVGWVTPALPYTGPSPRRLYLSCQTWPGRSGMVPTPTSIAPAAPAPRPRIRRRRRRRRRRRYR